MGFYFNPTNDGFAESLRSEIYVDKTGIIAYTNKVLGTKQKYVCISRPRRFGKTMAAEMLVAYYSKGCDSRWMFHSLAASKYPSFEMHLNKYNIVYLNMQEFLSKSNDIKEMINKLTCSILDEVLEEFPDFKVVNDYLPDNMQNLYKITKIPIVFIIDEWDCIFREHKTEKIAQNVYLDFLRALLKDKRYVALTYMTGILPIKKYGTHSALNMFSEFSMIDSSILSEFVGFTQNEVKVLCDKYRMDYEEMSAWYDGYCFPDLENIYNPKSIVESLLRKRFGNYWSQTETFEALSVYIKMNFDGLKDT